MDTYAQYKLIDTKYMTMKNWVKNYDPTLPQDYPDEYAKWTTTKGTGTKKTGPYAGNYMTIEIYDVGEGWLAYVNTFDYADMFMEGIICRDIRRQGEK